MKNIGKILSVILSLMLLYSCTVNVSNEDVTLPGVTIETYKPSTSASKTETEPAVTTEPTVTTLPVTTEPLTSSDTAEISTEASTEPSEKTEVPRETVSLLALRLAYMEDTHASLLPS